MDKPEQPNAELLIVKSIQGLISAASRELSKIKVEFNFDNPKPWQAKDKAIVEINSFEKTLFELQKAFE